ncbi:hypothetical protein ABW20_dc0100005 [Dactylellina cionopaga]|nr:hypothetical protein ABW20_dc0100005 [Dactylellina cionopaga]
MATQTELLHPLVEFESPTFTALTDPRKRKSASELFHKIEELECLGRFDEVYKVLQSIENLRLLSTSSPSHLFLLGSVKLSHGYYTEGKENYVKAQNILQNATEELSEESQQILDFITIRLLFLDSDSKENNDLGFEMGCEAYIKWARDKEAHELDYFSLLIEKGYYEMMKDLSPARLKITGASLEELQAHKAGLLEILRSRHLDILKAQIPKGNVASCFPFLLAKLNGSKELSEVMEIQDILEQLLQKHKVPLSLANTIIGYCQIRIGQLTTGKDQAKHFKEARRLYKAAGNLEAPCELESLETLRKGQEYVLAGTGEAADMKTRLIHVVNDLGKLYGKFTELNYPNRMQNILRQINDINEAIIFSHDISVITCRLWRQLGKATGLKVNATTEFIAVMADLMKTDDIKEALTVFNRFKEEEEENWDTNTRINWLKGMATAHVKISRYDEAIQALEEAELILKDEWRYQDAIDIREQILYTKERRLQTLSGEDKVYALDDLLEELDATIAEEQRIGVDAKQILRKMLWKAGLIIGDRNLTSLERAASEGAETIALVERQVKELVDIDTSFRPFANDTERMKAILLKRQGKFDEAVAMVEKLLPSKWKNFKSRTDIDEIREVQNRMLVVLFYTTDINSKKDEIAPKIFEKRMKVCLHHLKEAMKLAENHRMVEDYSDALVSEAVCHLALGEPKKALPNLVRASRIQDEIRRASHKGDKFDSFVSNALATWNVSGGMADAALKACLQIPDAISCWWWIQKAKARSFSDMMQHGLIWQDSFTRITDDVSNLQLPWDTVSVNLKEMAMIYQLGNLMRTPVGYTLNNWDAEEIERVVEHRREQIRNLIDEIEQYPSIRGALTLSLGLPATHEDMTWLANYRQDDREVVFIDWAHAYDDIIVSIYRPGGIRIVPGLSVVVGTSQDAQIRIFKCKLTLPEVRNWVNEYLKNEDMPLESKNAYDDLDILNDLIEPIKALTDPEDLLVLSPTDILHGIPLHALTVGKGENGERVTLIERNPVVYIPSFSIMRQCIAKLRLGIELDVTDPANSALHSSTIIGVKVDYGEPDQAVAVSMEKMSKSLLGAEIISNNDCDLERFTNAAGNTTDILHFHGHMDYQDPRALQRYLVLGNDEQINGRELADLKFPKGTAPLVAIIACLSGGQHIMTGDEPIGIIPALLAAGAASVIATLWPTDSECGLRFGELLYEDRKYGGTRCDEGSEDVKKVWDIARGLRRAVLEIKEREETSAPYYWAPFALHGSWLRGTSWTGILERGDGINGLSAQFERDMEIRV